MSNTYEATVTRVSGVETMPFHYTDTLVAQDTDNIESTVNIPKKTTKYGVGYLPPRNMDEEDYYNIMYELIDLTKIKGLTIRQAQKIFKDCSDLVLETKL